MTQLPKVCILTAGKGTRMGAMSTYLNKALFQLNGRAIVSHIIEKFDGNTQFVIALGYLGEQVVNYLEMAHPNSKFQYVEVDNFDNLGSGPGYSLLCCKSELNQPFYMVSCDTIWQENDDINQTSQNWLGVSKVKTDDTKNYCNLEISDDAVSNIKDKCTVSEENHSAFIGLAFIKDFKTFFSGLRNNVQVSGEHQVSNGLKSLIDQNKVKPVEFKWTDVGTEIHYTNAVKQFENFDFSKQEEALYFVDRKVIKFFQDASITANRVIRSNANPSVFPKIDNVKDQFYSYRFVEGETLYARNNVDIFKKLISFLDSQLWQKKKAPRDFKELCHKFYFEKTNARLNKYHKKYPGTDVENMINGVLVPSASTLLNHLDWSSLTHGVPVFFHGDLQFDNILYSERNKKFVLLDWRQDFAGNVEVGDLYYDLAKIYGGMILNYDLIKLNMFDYEEENGQIYFDFVQRKSKADFAAILKNYVIGKNLDWNKVETLVGLIYLNMSPLHHFPFDKMLYSLGRSMLKTSVRNGTAHA